MIFWLSAEDDVCSDQEWAFDNDRFTTDPGNKGTPYIWLHPGNEFAESREACESEQNSKC